MNPREEKALSSLSNAERLDQALKFINSREKTVEDKIKLQKQRLEQKLNEFYSPGFHLTKEKYDFVQKCIGLYCSQFPDDAGMILYTHIENIDKSDVSEMLIKAGANLSEVSYEWSYKDSCFELALKANAPASLLTLFIPKFMNVRIEILNVFNNKKFQIKEGYEPIIKACLKKLCEPYNGSYELGVYLNRCITYSKPIISQWIIEAGADLYARDGEKDWWRDKERLFYTLYYAIVSHQPKEIYQACFDRGFQNVSTNFGGWLSGSAVLIALLSGNDVAFDFYRNLFPSEVTKAAYDLKNCQLEKFDISYAKTSLTRSQAKEKLWRINNDEKVRCETLDREIMAIVFYNLSTVDQCLKQYDLFDKYIARPKTQSCSFLCASHPRYIQNAYDLLDTATARLCQIVRKIPSLAERIDVCESLMKHPMFSEEHNKYGFDAKSRVAILMEFRAVSMAALGREPRFITP